jgi:hypothetical protein
MLLILINGALTRLRTLGVGGGEGEGMGEWRYLRSGEKNTS